MPTFITTDEITTKLQALEADPTMITKDSYSPVGEWPDNRMPFVDYHLAYLRTHKLVDPVNYLSNLELMIKRR
jgi:hypothetical protein